MIERVHQRTETPKLTLFLPSHYNHREQRAMAAQDGSAPAGGVGFGATGGGPIHALLLPGCELPRLDEMAEGPAEGEDQQQEQKREQHAPKRRRLDDEEDDEEEQDNWDGTSIRVVFG